jgi:hypothetical protein
MDERHILAREVMQHRAAIAELLASLGDIEQNLKRIAPERLVRKAAALRLAVMGREAAVAVSSARLKVLIRCAAAANEPAAETPLSRAAR